MHIANEFDLDKYVDCFNDRGVMYFDYAATTFLPKKVIKSWSKYQNDIGVYYGKGNNVLSEKALYTYNDSKNRLHDFFNISKDYKLIFGKNVTELINLTSLALLEHVRPMDIVLIGPYEHHSNILPWKYMAKKRGMIFIEMPLTINDEIDWEYLEGIKRKVKIVAFSSVSNTNGFKVDVDRVCKIFDNSLIFVDESQAVAHGKICNNDRIDIHFMSSHKMYGPKNIAGAFVKKELLDSIPPVFLGGGMVETVSLNDTWLEGERKFEAGTVDIGLIKAWSEACTFMQEIGFDAITNIEYYCFSKIDDVLINNPKIRIVSKAKECNSLISFVHKEKHAHDIEQYLANNNIIIRSGNMCAQPSIRKMGENAINRISFGIGISRNDVDKMCIYLREV